MQQRSVVTSKGLWSYEDVKKRTDQDIPRIWSSRRATRMGWRGGGILGQDMQWKLWWLVPLRWGWGREEEGGKETRQHPFLMRIRNLLGSFKEKWGDPYFFTGGHRLLCREQVGSGRETVWHTINMFQWTRLEEGWGQSLETGTSIGETTSGWNQQSTVTTRI